MATEEARKELGVDQKKEEEKWVTHYSSKHQILLVGEGDFSFSLSLASSFGSAANICATSLDSEDDVINKYKNGKSNLENLKKLNASILHRVDATKMKNLDALKRRKFDRIIFNFPHSGFHGNEDYYWVIQNHKTLVRGFFSNASRMLQVNGEIHVNHKITPPYCYWNLEELASENSLELIVSVEFKIGDYPGYNNKRGAGPKCDEPFPLYLCNTYKFRFLGRGTKLSRQFQDSPAQLQLLHPNISGFNYNHRNHMNPFPLLPQLPSTVDAMNDCSWIFNTCSNAEFGRHINSPREAELLCTLSNFSLLPRNHIQCYGGLPSAINAGLGSHINYPIQAGLQCRYQTTNVNHFQPRLELTSTICAGRDIEYRSQAGLQHTFPDFSWPQRYRITDVNHIQPHVGLPSAINAALGSHINYPIQAGLQCRYQTTNVNHFQPCLELTSTICAGRDIEYRSQAGLQHTFPDFSWPQSYHITDVNHIQPHVGLPSTIEAGNVHSWVFGGNLNDQIETYPRPAWNALCSIVERLRYNSDVPYSLPAGVKHDFGRQTVEVRKRTSREDVL